MIIDSSPMNTTCFAFPSTSPGHAAWVPDPSCRGTFGIALLCLSTTLICIWSSVHRDIPLERLSAARSLLRSAPLVFVALFAPELLFYFALNQFLCAKNLVKLGSRSKGFGVPSDEERGGDGDERISSGLEVSCCQKVMSPYISLISIPGKSASIFG